MHSPSLEYAVELKYFEHPENQNTFMLNTFRIPAIIMFAVIMSSAFVQIASGQATDYFGLPSVNFDGLDHRLAWSSHPNDNYYKHEYIEEGDNVESFKKMIMIEAVITENSPKEIMDAKIDKLKSLKSSNPYVNYDMFSKDGEYLLDFLLTDKADSPGIVERNVYRYKQARDGEGRNMVILFGVSERAYGPNVDSFIAGLKGNLSSLRDAVASYGIPELSVK